MFQINFRISKKQKQIEKLKIQCKRKWTKCPLANILVKSYKKTYLENSTYTTVFCPGSAKTICSEKLLNELECKEKKVIYILEAYQKKERKLN